MPSSLLRSLARVIPAIRRLLDQRDALVTQVSNLQAKAIEQTASFEADAACLIEQMHGKEQLLHAQHQDQWNELVSKYSSLETGLSIQHTALEIRLAAHQESMDAVMGHLRQDIRSGFGRADHNANEMVVRQQQSIKLIKVIQDHLARLEHNFLQLEQRHSDINQRFVRLENEISQQTVWQEAHGAEIKDTALLSRHNKRQTNTLLRRTSSYSGRIKTLFLVHFAQNWSALEPVYRAMMESDDFEPIVAIFDYFIISNIEDQDKLTLLLNARGIPHLRWGGNRSAGSFEHDDLGFLLEYLEPDIVFRQTHWDGSVPGALRTPVSAGYRICYLPYHMEVAQVPDAQENQEMHHAAWRIFCFCEAHQQNMRSLSMLGGRNTVVTGHPRLDEISAASQNEPRWRDIAGSRPYRVLWAPHHSTGASWLRFGSFHQHWRAMVAFTRDNPDIEVMLRAHHILFKLLQEHGNMDAAEITDFHAEWASLPNARIDDDASYVRSFSWSDVMITEGVSFLAEYQVTGKPLIFLERPDHVAFTPIGDSAAEASYRVSTIEAGIGQVMAMRAGADDPLQSRRERLSASFMPFPGKAVDRILNEIRTGLSTERRYFALGKDH